MRQILHSAITSKTGTIKVNDMRRVRFADEHNYLSPANDADSIFDSDNIYDIPYATTHK